MSLFKQNKVNNFSRNRKSLQRPNYRSYYKMFHHHTLPYKTPMKKMSSILSNNQMSATSSYSENNQNQPFSHRRSHSKVQRAFDKFNSVNSTIEDIDLTKNNFNLIEFETQKKGDEKIKYDPQMLVAKLRRLENKAEVNRIDNELQQRKHKKSSKKKTVYKSPDAEYIKNYKATYSKFLQNSQLLDIPLRQNDSDEEDQKESKEITGIHPKYHQLKKHTKIIEYTLQKIKQKKESDYQQIKDFEERKSAVKSDINRLRVQNPTQFMITARPKFAMTQRQPSKTIQDNPQAIVQEKYKRIMTMKAKDKLSKQVTSNPRCQKMISRQQDILHQMEALNQNLSKDNMKRLKSKFHEVVNQLHKGDRKRKQIMLTLQPLSSRQHQRQRASVDAKIYTQYNKNQNFGNRKNSFSLNIDSIDNQSWKLGNINPFATITLNN